MDNVIDFESVKKNEPFDFTGLDIGLKFISMPSRLKDNLANGYRELSIKLDIIIDLLSRNRRLSKEHWQTLEELKVRADSMREVDKHYMGILEAARKAGYYDDKI